MENQIKETETIKDDMGNTFKINVYKPPLNKNNIDYYNGLIREAITIGINSKR